MGVFVPRFLRHLRDVLVAAPADNEVLAYDSADGKWKNSAAAGGGVTDHGALTGLADDDHTHYAILAPTASARNVIQPTAGAVIAAILKAHAAQSVDIFQIQDSAAAVLLRINQNGWVGIGVAPTNPIDIARAVTGVAGPPAIGDYGLSIKSVVDYVAPVGQDGGSATAHEFDLNYVGVSDTSPVGTLYNLNVITKAKITSPAAGAPSYFVGASSYIEVDPTNVYPLGDVVGLIALAAHKGDSTVIDLYGSNSYVDLAAGAGSVQKVKDIVVGYSSDYRSGKTQSIWRGIDLGMPYVAGTGGTKITDYYGLALRKFFGEASTMTNFYGVYIEDPGTQVTGLKYSVYAAGGRALFVDGVRVRLLAAPADATYVNGDGEWWWDQANSLPKWKGKTSGGVVVNFTPADAQALADHLSDALDVHDASAISNVPAGGVAATTVQAAIDELDAEKQPVDSDLTAIAALTTTAYGRALLELANAAALRTAGGLVIGTDVQAFDTELAQIAALADPNADRILFWDDSAGAYTFLTPGTNLTITGTTIDWASTLDDLSDAVITSAVAGDRLAFDGTNWRNALTPPGDPTLPAAAKGHSFTRAIPISNQTPLASQRLQLVSMWLIKGVPVSSITFFSGSTGLVTGVNQLFGVYDDNAGTSSGTARALLRGSNDDTSTAWAGNTAKTLNLTSSYTPTRTGQHFLGILINATTVPTLLCSSPGSTVTSGPDPDPCGSSNTGVTALPNPANAMSATTIVPYCYWS